MKYCDVVFLDVEDVVDAHAAVMAAHGAQASLRDRSLLESAVMAARAGYYGSVCIVAAAYAHGVAKNHPFEDGNKRAGLLAAVTFLEANGFELDAELGPDAMVDLVTGAISPFDFARILSSAIGGDVSITFEESS